MYCNRSLNRKANHLNKSVFEWFTAIVKSRFDEMLNKDGTGSIHHQIIQELVMEMFEFVKGRNSEILREMLRVSNEGFYELWQRTFFHIPSTNTELSDTETVRFPSPKIRDLILNQTKHLENVVNFKITIKKSKPTSHLFRTCKTYFHGVGFL